MSLPARVCTIEGCDNKHLALGYCRKHYWRFRKHGSPFISLIDRENDGACSVIGCPKPYYGNGLCEMHYARMRKRGEAGDAQPERSDAKGYRPPIAANGEEGKRCPKCGQVKPLSKFDGYATGRSRVASYCGPCDRERVRESVARDPERWREYVRRNRAAYPERYRDSYQRRRALKRRNGAFVILDKDMRRIYASPCAHCGTRQDVQADHIIPIARGGRHSIGNLQPLCGKCNRSKGRKTMTEWRLRDR